MTQKYPEMCQKIETELKLEGRSKHTVKMYCYYNIQFLEHSKKPVEQITKDDIKLYLAYLISDKQSNPKTVSLVKSALRYYYDDILKQGIVGDDVKTPKIHRKLPDVLTKDEVKKILAETKSFRSKIFIGLLYSSGLRVSELASLQWDNLNLEEKTGLIRAGKGNKDRFFILSGAIIEDLKKFKHNGPYVFPGQDGGHISTRTIQREINKAAKIANISKKVYCHLFRHAFGTHLAEAGTDIRVIQELMGHASIQTTQIYTTLSRNVLKSVKSPLDTL